MGHLQYRRSIYNPAVRSNAIFDKEYLQGMYGGVPHINGSTNIDPQFKTKKNGYPGVYTNQN